MSTPHKLKIKLVGADAYGYKTPATSKQPAEQPKPKHDSFKKNLLQRRVNRASPSQRVKTRMPEAMKGPCCLGTKKWGDGRGSEAFNDGVTFYCHHCMVELVMPPWAILDYASEAEFLADKFLTDN